MAIDEIFSTQLNKINEDLIFENIWFAVPSGIMNDKHLNVTLSNIGILGLIKSQGKSQNVTYPWQSGDELDVLVFTGRGNQFITQVVAP